MKHRLGWVATLALLLFALWLRLTQLYSLPVFVDESTHIFWAQMMARGTNAYPFLMDGRILLGVFLTPFVSGTAPLWITRAIAAVCSCLNVAVTLALGRRLGSPLTGWLAGLLYALLPYSVFHDRQILSDTLAWACGAVSLWLVWRLTMTHRRWLIAPLALMLAATFLFKFNSVPYLGMLVLAPVILSPSRLSRRRAIFNGALAVLNVALWLALFIFVFQSRLGVFEGVIHNANSASVNSFVECPPILCRGDFVEQFNHSRLALPAAFSTLGESVGVYWGWPLVILAGLAGLNLRQRRGALFLYALIGLTLGATLLAARGALPPRYYMFLSVSLAVLAPLGLATLIDWGGRWLGLRQHWAQQLVLLISFVALLYRPAQDSFQIIQQPALAPLPALDRSQYFTGAYATLGFHELGQAITLREGTPSHPIVVLVRNFVFHSLQAYYDPSYIEYSQNINVPWQGAAQVLEAQRPLYIADRVVATNLAELRADQTLVALYPRPEANAYLRLRRLTGTDPTTLQALFASLFTRPEGLLDDYDRLINEVAHDFTHDAVLIPYPSHQFAFLVERLMTQKRIEALDLGNQTPWDIPANIQRAERASLQDRTAQVIFLDEARLDPQRIFETWLTTHWFRLTERWYGPLRVVEYAGPGAEVRLTPIGVKFGDYILLESVETFEPRVAPGQPLRLRLNWQVLEGNVQYPLPRLYKVFVHVFNGGNLIAQHDGQPVGELRPTLTWQAGESLADQFAIQIPATVAIGQYQLRVGLYDLETEQRLRTTDGEFWEGGEIEIGH